MITKAWSSAKALVGRWDFEAFSAGCLVQASMGYLSEEQAGGLTHLHGWRKLFCTLAKLQLHAMAVKKNHSKL